MRASRHFLRSVRTKNTRATRRVARKLLMGFIPVIFLLSACEAAATPIARVTATLEEPAVAQATATQTPLPAVRYGFLGGAEQFVASSDQILTSAEVVPAQADIAAYDILATYGTVPDWQQSPISQHVALVLNPNVVPLTDFNILSLINSALSPRDLLDELQILNVRPANDQSRDALSVRVALANAGYPDGLTLTLAMENLPGAELVMDQLAQANLQTNLVALEPDEAMLTFTENRAHLLLIRWYDDVQRAAWVDMAGTENVLDLYTLPISYLVNGDLAIEFAPDGWPIPASR